MTTTVDAGGSCGQYRHEDEEDSAASRHSDDDPVRPESARGDAARVTSRGVATTTIVVTEIGAQHAFAGVDAGASNNVTFICVDLLLRVQGIPCTAQRV